jgi:hypothetical protein
MSTWVRQANTEPMQVKQFPGNRKAVILSAAKNLAAAPGRIFGRLPPQDDTFSSGAVVGI